MATDNLRTTAQIAGHPLHHMLVGFPIAFFVATFVCDLVVWRSGLAGWALATQWLLGAGLVMAALAAVAGLTDVLGDRRIRDIHDVWLHAGGNVVVVLLELYNFYSRYTQGMPAIVPAGPVLSLIVVCTLLLTGWKGGGMIYRHRVGIRNDGDPL